MATCKDCIHYELCNIHGYIDADQCAIFKNKSDFVEVKCRCKDCKHYSSYGRTSLVFEGENIQCGWCMLRAKTDEEHRMLPDDFCSYGERKDT